MKISGEKFARLRQAKMLSLSGLAAVLGISKERAFQLEKPGPHSIRWLTVQRMAAGLKIEPRELRDLLGWEGSAQQPQQPASPPRQEAIELPKGFEPSPDFKRDLEALIAKHKAATYAGVGGTDAASKRKRRKERPRRKRPGRSR